VLTGKTFSYRYHAGYEVVECLDRIPLENVEKPVAEHEPSVAPVARQVCGQDVPGVTLRKRAVRWLLVASAVGAAVVSAAYSTAAHAAPAAAQCGPWNPATDPYRGDQAEAVMRLTEIPEAERRQLADMVRQQYGWQRVMVPRSGQVGELREIRAMNFGAGRICAGPVDFSAWPAGRHESAKAYTVGRWSVLVFDSCRNVALATNGAALPPPAAPSREALEAARGPVIGFAPDGPPEVRRTVPEPGALALAALAIMGAIGIGRRGRA
jgi:hypothetical protein